VEPQFRLFYRAYERAHERSALVLLPDRVQITQLHQLEHQFERYITETVIYHQYKLTRRGWPDRQFASRDRAGAGQSRDLG
jgi:hypothetical protein